ncbi:hypothetical protein DPMN_112304 [Dreissena polymorpha]|uniref:Uncharacterized protein n=1 Tax=Dreissena polymorpha TaxID=45954 RepID=A0A9D4KGJ8_DREPO|nr:hypothetical protein DPMN_112304 [Dreissena polymorpha]
MKSAKVLPRYGYGRTDGRTEGRTTPKNIPPPMAGDNKLTFVFDRARPIFKLDLDIILIQLLTKFSEERMKTTLLSNFNKECLRNVNARVFTNQMWTDRRRTKTNPKTSPEQSVKLHPPPGSHETSVLTKFHEVWTKNVTFRVLTCFHYMHIAKAALPLGGHVFSPIWTIFELVRDINKTNALTKFHDDWAKIVTSRVFTRKTAPTTGGHVFQWT